MNIFLSLIYPLLASYLAANIFKQKIIHFLPVTYSFSVVTIYFFSIFDLYPIGVASLIPITLGLLTLGTIATKNTFINKKLLRDFTSPSIVFFLLIGILTQSQSKSLKFYEWDEFSYWGIAVKSIYNFGKIAIYAPIESTFPDYVPGLPLLASLFMNSNGQWDESIVYWSYQVFLLAIIFAITGNYTWKNLHVFLLLVSALLLTFTLFFDSFLTVYADPILGILFGYLLVLGNSESLRKNRTYLINFTILMCFLLLIKEIAIFFAGISLIILFINLLTSESYQTSKKSKDRLMTHNVPVFLLIASFVLFTKFSWGFLLDSKNFTSNRDSLNLILNTVFNGNGGFDSAYLEQIWINFLQKADSQPLTTLNGLYLTTFNWVTIFAIIFTVTILMPNERIARIRISIVNLILVFGIWAYFKVLTFAYATSFTSSEGYGLVSFERYVSTYFCGLAVYVIGKGISQLDSIKGNSNQLIILWVIFLMFQSMPNRIIGYFTNPDSISSQVRSTFEIQRWLISKMSLPPNSKVWIVAQHTKGFEFYLLQYELLPANVGKIPFSIGSPSDPGDLWTDQSYDVAKWSKELETYDYVFINNVTETFVKEFGSMFQDPSSLNLPGFYKVSRVDDSIILIKVL